MEEADMSATRQRTALITGASSGIGRSTSLYLARKGYSVIGTSRSMEPNRMVEARADQLRIKPRQPVLHETAVEKIAIGGVRDHAAMQ